MSGRAHRLDRPASFPIDRLAGPQGARQPQPLHHPPDAPLERHPGGGKFGADVGDVGGDAGAEHEPAFADPVEGRELMRQHDRVAQRR